MPLKDDTAPLGDVMVRLGTDDRVSIAIADLIDRTQRTLDEATRARLAKLDAPGGFAAIEAISATGVPVRFDSGLQELRITPDVDQRQTDDISVAPAISRRRVRRCRGRRSGRAISTSSPG
ncbi:MAG: hypothetical protein HC841_05365 [Verrucomicrobiae bacterium]|nr:hypothetical protein [Verrucomicrobiae bacterium]